MKETCAQYASLLLGSSPVSAKSVSKSSALGALKRFLDVQLAEMKRCLLKIGIDQFRGID